MSLKSPMEAAKTRLCKELREMQQKKPIGYVFRLIDEQDLTKWQCGIFGPPNTIYQGGYFKLIMTFPNNYPYAPPTVKFTPPLFHPNVYTDGNVCLSILHPPTNDPQSGEKIEERWSPIQTVDSVMISIVSMLDAPNISSPANVEASKMYKEWKEFGKLDYVNKIKSQIENSKAEAALDKVKVPITDDEYCAKPKTSSEVSDWTLTDSEYDTSDEEQ
ncbi:Ubiquitin-conjugating enzyme E2 R2-like isoform X2 [Aphelenchoides besseyi]|nr:Ubiquitin-conjugating enzyme E2 R2-like isoform X2 [Aphelenchoides besseyi]